jgi:hypothetical protein
VAQVVATASVAAAERAPAAAPVIAVGRSLPPLLVPSLGLAPATPQSDATDASGQQQLQLQSSLLVARRQLAALRFAPKLVDLSSGAARRAVAGTAAAAVAMEEEKVEGRGLRTARAAAQWARRERDITRLAAETASIKARVAAVRAAAALPTGLK